MVGLKTVFGRPVVAPPRSGRLLGMLDPGDVIPARFPAVLDPVIDARLPGFPGRFIAGEPARFEPAGPGLLAGLIAGDRPFGRV
jgi:hypothetical protein